MADLHYEVDHHMTNAERRMQTFRRRCARHDPEETEATLKDWTWRCIVAIQDDLRKARSAIDNWGKGE